MFYNTRVGWWGGQGWEGEGDLEFGISNLQLGIGNCGFEVSGPGLDAAADQRLISTNR